MTSQFQVKADEFLATLKPVIDEAAVVAMAKSLQDMAATLSRIERILSGDDASIKVSP